MKSSVLTIQRDHKLALQYSHGDVAIFDSRGSSVILQPSEIAKLVAWWTGSEDA